MRSVRPGWRGAAVAAVAAATLAGCGALGGTSSGGCVGPDLRFEVEVHVPRGTRAGLATVSDDLQYPTSHVLVVGRRGANR